MEDNHAAKMDENTTQMDDSHAAQRDDSHTAQMDDSHSGPIEDNPTEQSSPPPEDPIESPHVDASETSGERAKPHQEEDFKEKYLRELAEKENMRKRLLREQVEGIRLAGEKSAIALLPTLDQFESALHFARSMSAEIKNWAVGFEMILTQIKDWLASQGISPFDSQGEMFTPLKHEAVERIIDNNQPEGLILKEFTKGYSGRHRVIRPARVGVCAHQLPKEPETPLDESSEPNQNPQTTH